MTPGGSDYFRNNRSYSLVPSLTWRDWTIVLILLGIRLFIEVNSRLTILPELVHDDGHFMRLANYFSAGNWLGPYNQFTLMKGPGYPIFISLIVMLGGAVSIGHALFHIFAVCMSAWAALLLSRSKTIFYFSFVFLISIPIYASPDISRILRDQIYWSQTLVIFSTATIALFAAPHTRWARFLLNAGCGLTLGWAWLTREEGFWFAPGLAILFVSACLIGPDKFKRLRLVAETLTIVGVSFAIINLAFMIGNYRTYGSFVGVEFQEPNFKAAMRALTSIEDGGHIDLVPVTAAAREKAAAVSPTFAPLAEQLRPQGPLHDWTTHGCRVAPHTCGEMIGGMFVWALRDAAAAVGYYSSPTAAQKKFGQIAKEIEAACLDRRLNCNAGFDGHLPRMSVEQLLRLPASFVEAIKSALLINPTYIPPSTTKPLASVALMDEFWSFLNFPRIFGPEPRDYIMRGWAFDRDTGEWPTLYIRNENTGEQSGAVQRVPGPDVARALDDSRAKDSRFIIKHACTSSCTLVAKFRDGSELNIPFSGDIRNKRGDERDRKLVIDENAPILHPASIWNRNADAARKITNAAFSTFRILFPILAATGLISFFVSIIFCMKLRTIDATVLVALSAWTFALVRLSLVAVTNTSSFPAINAQYIAPGTYMIAIAVIFSISAAIRFSRLSKN